MFEINFKYNREHDRMLNVMNTETRMSSIRLDVINKNLFNFKLEQYYNFSDTGDEWEFL